MFSQKSVPPVLAGPGITGAIGVGSNDPPSSSQLSGLATGTSGEGGGGLSSPESSGLGGGIGDPSSQ